MAGLPPPPINDAPGSFTWLEWYRQLRNYVSTSGSVPWSIINFSGSNITDIALRDHNQLQNTQGGSSGEKYHLTLGQHNAMSNSLAVELTTSGTVLPTTPTLFNPALATVVTTNGISYDISGGEFVFTNGGVYTMSLTLNAIASGSNRKLYFYAELDTGSGFNILRYSARSREVVNSVEDQIVFTTTLYLPPGAKTRHYIWSSASSITLNSTDVPGTTAGTVTLPAFRVQWTGSL